MELDLINTEDVGALDYVCLKKIALPTGFYELTSCPGVEFIAVTGQPENSLPSSFSLPSGNRLWHLYIRARDTNNKV